MNHPDVIVDLTAQTHTHTHLEVHTLSLFDYEFAQAASAQFGSQTRATKSVISVKQAGRGCAGDRRKIDHCKSKPANIWMVPPRAIVFTLH